MKKVIKGKLYNSDTARCLATYESYDRGSADRYTEELYIKRTGEYFLYGKGGPGSPYRKPAGKNAFIGGENIIPLTLEEAQAWGEKHLDADQYMNIFEVEEEEPPNALKEIRESKGLTQTELGNLGDVSLASIQKYEYGEVIPPVDVAIKIAKILGGTVEDIWG